MEQIANTFPTEESKLQLAGDWGKYIKETVVGTYGIGSNIPHLLAGWRGEHMVAGCELDRALETQHSKYVVALNSAVSMRVAFGIDAITLVCDGYSHREGQAPEDAAVQFAAGDRAVEEAILVVHVDKWQPRITCLQLPYRVGLSKEIEWLDTHLVPLAYDAAYPHGLSAALNAQPTEGVNVTLLVEQMFSMGVHLKVVAP